MANKMLIDASHPEETRVVVLRGNRIEEFDFESANKKQLRGNIYLAKVTRVEPSLQAAFVEYGGNRHGFLAFSEIHPDYYQIPVADRLALLEDEARSQDEDEDEESRPHRRMRGRRRNPRDRQEKRAASVDETLSEDAESHADEPGREKDSQRGFEGEADDLTGDGEPPATIGEIEAAELRAERSQDVDPPASEEAPTEPAIEDLAPAEKELDEVPTVAADVDAPTPPLETGEAVQALEVRPQEAGDEIEADEESAEDEEEEQVEQIGGDALEEMPTRVHRLRRQYKIQEVIKRRQVLLVQVVKEERGNKGAALTTYLSLAGRYSVLMPNTARGGGISRKITDPEDRKRLKAIAQELDVPEGMGVILRTAGAARTKQEVRRDFEYLLRMWETVRELTLKSSAPTLVYEEGSLIKRAIRDLYTKEVEEIQVAGDEGFREARDFMRLLMPSHVKTVELYQDKQPLFARFGVEAQLDSMFSNQVTLKSGGYLVINQTEALVAIDVNSGRSTREHNIEDTALRTNLEAADEIARQLRLRDLAGLIVVDFIDMEEHRNNRAVERRIKEALKNDRARIQVGRISHFGLLEMSRQRMRTGVFEGSTVVCPHCGGSGSVRSTASIALHVLRVLDDALMKNADFNLTLRTRTAVALYILNQKRAHLQDIEERYGVSVSVAADDSLTGSSYHSIERGEPAAAAARPERRAESVRMDSLSPPDLEEEEEGAAEEADAEETEALEEGSGAESSGEDEGGEGLRRRRRRRRRRGRGADRETSGIQAEAPQPSDEALGLMAPELGAPLSSGLGSISDGEVDETEAAAGLEADGPRPPGSRRRRGRGRGRFGERTSADQPASNGDRSDEEGESASAVETAAADDASPSPVQAAPAAAPAPASEPRPEQPAPVELPEAAPPPQKRSGWWQRAKATFGG